MAGDIVRLAPEHDRSAFESGELSLDRWLREQAGQSDRRDGARTYVLCEGTRVIGYYSLCTYSVQPSTVPKSAQIGRHDIPSLLIARLAVDRGAQGRGVGSRLLVDALARAVRVADEAGARLVVVHALHDSAAGFYTRYGFRPFNEEQPLALYILMHDVRRTFGAVPG